MASKNICTTCLRALRRQQPHPLALRRLPLSHQQQQLTQHSQQRTYAATPKPTLLKPKTPPPPPPAKEFQPHAFHDPLSKKMQDLATDSLRGPYLAYNSTEELFLECSRQCAYTMPSILSTPPTDPPQNAAGEHLGEGTGFWLTPKSKGGLGLDVTFQSWAQVLYLYMWMLTVRFRCFPKEYVKDWHQHLLDHFFYAAEDRMATWHGMAARGVRNKNLKEQWMIWRGVQLGYDEGLIKGDAAMAAAVWRGVFKSDPEVDVGDVALVTAYVMRELQSLSKIPDVEITQGKMRFGEVKSVQQALLIESRAMRLPFTEGEGEKVEASVE